MADLDEKAVEAAQHAACVYGIHVKVCNWPACGCSYRPPAIRAAITAYLDATDAALPRWRHKKRGTTYTEINRAELQVARMPPIEGVQIIIYRGDDGKMWARGRGEFEDGRFEPSIPAPPAGSAQETAPRNIEEGNAP